MPGADGTLERIIGNGVRERERARRPNRALKAVVRTLELTLTEKRNH